MLWYGSAPVDVYHCPVTGTTDPYATELNISLGGFIMAFSGARGGGFNSRRGVSTFYSLDQLQITCTSEFPRVRSLGRQFMATPRI